MIIATNLLKRLKHGFWGQPIYIWFWTVGTLYFIYTFVEGHAYLLPGVFESPIRDLQVQWKSCGTLVGSYNFLMYGSLTYVGEKLSRDKSYAQSPIAFWLFGVGCLNSFTNYVHHTYHLPQTEVVKWVAFIVSMMEVIILVKLMIDLGKMLSSRKADAEFCGRGGWLTQAKYWTVGMLFTSIVISVPTFNTLIHGTQLVMGHAMGATVGIDSLVLLGTSSWLVLELKGDAIKARMDAPITKVSILLVAGGAGDLAQRRGLRARREPILRRADAGVGQHEPAALAGGRLGARRGPRDRDVASAVDAQARRRSRLSDARPATCCLAASWPSRP